MICRAVCLSVLCVRVCVCLARMCIPCPGTGPSRLPAGADCILPGQWLAVGLGQGVPGQYFSHSSPVV